MVDERNKRIFISDIHMNDSRSFSPGGTRKPYAWFYENRISELANFLDTQILQSRDVKELIILGDLFDLWACPSDFEPTTYAAIIEAGQNKPVIAKLREIAASGVVKLIYVPGNHDMLIDPVITEAFPGIEYQYNGPGQGTFTEDGICAEHGDLYSLFCSPDSWSMPPGVLPLGSFISRIAAYKHSTVGGGPDRIEIVKFFIKKFIEDPDFSKSLILAIAKDAGLKGTDSIIMNGIDHKPQHMTIFDVIRNFPNQLRSWKPVAHLNMKPIDAVFNDLTGLDAPAQSEFFLKKRSRVVVFGHTHNYFLCGYNCKDEYHGYCELSLNPREPVDFIYANTGTWVNHSRCSYVETELDEREGKHHVRLFRRKEGAPFKQHSHRWINL